MPSTLSLSLIFPLLILTLSHLDFSVTAIYAVTPPNSYGGGGQLNSYGGGGQPNNYGGGGQPNSYGSGGQPLVPREGPNAGQQQPQPGGQLQAPSAGQQQPPPEGQQQTPSPGQLQPQPEGQQQRPSVAPQPPQPEGQQQTPSPGRLQPQPEGQQQRPSAGQQQPQPEGQQHTPSPGRLQPQPETRQSGAEASTPPSGQLLCQQPEPTEEELITRQEQAARDLEKAVVGLEIAQGAIEITLGAIRIAAAGTTAEVIRREDAIAASRAAASGETASRGFEGAGTPAEPIRRHARAAEEAKKAVCARHRQTVLADDPYTNWNSGYRLRMRRSAPFAPIISEEAHNFVRPTPNPKAPDSYPMKLPSTEEAEHLLNLLENLLDTNNEVLRLLNIDLPPLTNQVSNPGAVLLRQYRQRLERQRDIQREYGQTGYLDEERAQQVFEEDTRWKANAGRRRDVHTLTSELAQLNRMRRRLSVD